MIISAGPVCIDYATATEALDNSILWLMLPYAILIYASILISTKILHPQLLKKNRFASFSLCVLGIAYLVNVLAIYLEYFFMMSMHLPPSLKNPLSPWIFVYTAISSLLFAMTIFGFFLWEFFEVKQNQNTAEQIYKNYIREKSRSFSDNLNMPEVKSRLKKITSNIITNPLQATRQIGQLSESLRKMLYRNPNIESHTSSLPNIHEEHNSSLYIYPQLLTQDKYRFLRHFLLILIMAVISFGLIFDFPDTPVFDASHICYAISFFLIITTLIYINLFLILPLFLRKGRERLYAYLLLSILFTIYIGMNVFAIFYGNLTNKFGVSMPIFLVPVAVAGNMLSSILLFAGASALYLFKKNIVGKWTLNRLETESALTELEMLRQQISPHTLFNLLNNISFLSYDEPSKAIETLNSFEKFLDYIIYDASRCATTIKDELSFVENYITLEKSSGRYLETAINCPEDLLNLHIPHMLLIPFVENAVKHSANSAKNRYINIQISKKENFILFSCENSYPFHFDNDPSDSYKSNGIGLYNTDRRLELLYGNNFQRVVKKTISTYKISLKFPVYEMYSR